jgi:adenylate kinase family enzyme
MIDYQKILVVGTPCTGKTTLAKILGAQMHIKSIDLDDLHWLPGWQERPKEELRHKIETEIIPLDQWIVSGNYTTAGRNNIWKEAQTVIWLDLPLSTILYRYVKRTYWRIRYKEECCNGNFETLRDAVFSKEILLKYILRSHFVTRRPVYKRWMKNEMRNKQWIVCKSQSDVDQLTISNA